jgi:hypothetical protein
VTTTAVQPQTITPSGVPPVPPSSEWVVEFTGRGGEFERSRGVDEYFSAMHLPDGDRLPVQRVAPGPGSAFITVDVLPPAASWMVASGDRRPLTPIQASVPLDGIVRVDLLTRLPDWASWAEGQAFGFV